MSPVPVPRLPGYAAPPAPRDGPWYKPQTLKFLKTGFATESPLAIVEQQPDIDAQPSEWPTKPEPISNQRPPRWLAEDGKVLRFYAWYRENVPEASLEPWRVRRVVLLYYLVDDTAQLYEPTQHNSGLHQGPLIKRHPIPFNGRTLQPSDLLVGTSLNLYARTFHLVDADAFTRAWFADAATPQPPPHPYPRQPLEEAHAHLQQRAQAAHAVRLPGEMTVTQYCEAMLGKPVVDRKLKQFLEQNKRVLRFHCSWSDPLLPPAPAGKRNSPYDMSTADVRRYTLHYFLEDDTVEVLERHEANGGRDPFPALLRRAPLPKAGTPPATLAHAPPADAFVRPHDIRLGGTVSVYGRQLFVYDCDDFTRQWLQEHLGYEAAQVQQLAAEPPRQAPPRPAPPPPTGFGSDLDSLQSCLALVPKPPKKDIAKLLHKDKDVLRFATCMAAPEGTSLSPADAARRFVLSYFVADDTLAIFEPPVRNSGIVGGRFLERTHVAHVTPGSLFVGAHLHILQRVFLLTDADEYTLTYMQRDPSTFPAADPTKATAALRAACQGAGDALRRCVCEADPEGRGLLSQQQVAAALAAVDGVVPHHALTWFRAHQRDGVVAVDDLLALQC